MVVFMDVTDSINADNAAELATADTEPARTAVTTGFERYYAHCRNLDLMPIQNEHAILSSGIEVLPQCAIDVINANGVPSDAYFDWLVTQTRTPL